jgi:hypothetical protein
MTLLNIYQNENFWNKVVDKNKTFHVQDTFPVSSTISETMKQIGPYAAYGH